MKLSSSFTDIIPYVAIENDLIISEDPDQLTTILELHISTIDSVCIMQEVHDHLMRVLCELPSDATVSNYYSKLFVNPDPIQLNLSDKPIVNYMEKNKYETIMGMMSPSYTCYMSITIPVENSSSENKGILSRFRSSNRINYTELMKCDNYREAHETLKFKIDGLISAIPGKIFRLKKPQIIQFISELINHKRIKYSNNIEHIIQSDWNSSAKLMSKSPGYVYYNNSYNSVLSLRSCTTESRLPSKTHAGLNRIFTHQDIWQIPFIIQHTIHFPSKSKGLRKARRREEMISGREGLARYFRWLEKTPEGPTPERLREIVAAAIEYVENSRERFLEQHFHVYLWDSSLNALDKKCRKFMATVHDPYKLKREKLNIKGAYFSVLPGNEQFESIRTTLPSFNVADFMPIDTPNIPYITKKNKYEIYYHNEMDTFCKINPYDPRCANHNGLWSGQAGQGKSFTVQDKIWQMLKYDPCIAIVDFAGEGQGSYLSLVNNLNGTYIEIGFNSTFAFNPFAGPLFEKDENGEIVPKSFLETSLISFFDNMVLAASGNRLSGSMRSDLSGELKKYYLANDNNKNNQCNLNDFAQKHLKNNEKFIDGRFNLFKEIYEFIGEGIDRGPYAKFFKASTELKSNNIVCFDLAGLDGHDRLKAVLVPALLATIMNTVFGSQNRSRLKLCIIDECWKILNDSNAQLKDFVTAMFRTCRKLNASIDIVTQSFYDVLSTDVASTITTNTSYFYAIGNVHNPNDLRMLKAGNVALSQYDIDRIKNQRQKRDFYLLTPYYKGQLRLYPSKEFCMLATTHPPHKEILWRYQEKLGVSYTTPEVLEAAKHEF